MRISAMLAAAALCLVALTARADGFNSVVVYGDSLSDNGNLYKLTGGFAPQSPPYYMGRFSNGPVAVEQLATQLNAALYDFAIGGATTGVGNIADYGTATHTGLFGLPGIATEQRALGGKLPTTGNSLFVVWGGANDYESLFNPGAPTPTVASAQATAKAAAANIAQLVSTLQMYGASSILVPNLPNLAATPEFSGSSTASAYTVEFNTDLAADLSPGATLFDTNAVLTSIVNNPGQYGLANVTTPCLTESQNKIMVCSDPSQYLFWDDIHPTTAVDSILARDFATAVTPAAAATPEPSSLLMLGTGLVSVTGLLFRRRMA